MRETFVLGLALLLVQIPLIAFVLVQEVTWGGPDVERASDVDVDPNGNIYVTGNTFSTGHLRNIVLVKLRLPASCPRLTPQEKPQARRAMF